MPTPAQKITLQPGGSVVLKQGASSVEIEAASCPDAEEPGNGWEFPKGVVALRVDDQIVGALPMERVVPKVDESFPTPTDEQAKSLGEEVDVAAVLSVSEASQALQPPAEGESLPVLVSSEEIDLDAFKPVLTAAEKSGARVEFAVKKQNGG
jgi:hypothetical protein